MSFSEPPSNMRLSEICTDVSYGYTASAETEKNGPKFLRITDIQGGIVSWDTVPYCQIEKSQESKYLLEKGDIVVARTGNSTGENYIFYGNEKTVFASYLIRFRVNDKIAFPHFVWYQMRSASWWRFVNSSKTGSAQAGANAKVLGSFELSLPGMQTQIEIASIFQSFDDRIALLRETNTTLEAIAQALFKSWFVDFDPVRAKQEGLEPEGMDADTAALFPDSFEESELGLVPKGWVHVPFTDTVNVIGGGTPKTSISEYWNGNIPWFSVVDAPTITDIFVIDTQKHITEQGLNNSSTKLLAEGTTIISARGTVGRLALVGRQMAMNQSCYGLRGKSDDSYFTYFSTYRLVESLKQHSHGSVFDTITTQTMTGVFVIYPTKTVITAFETVLKPVMDRIKENLEQAETLTTLRDTLLPRLISGQLRLPDTEALNIYQDRVLVAEATTEVFSVVQKEGI